MDNVNFSYTNKEWLRTFLNTKNLDDITNEINGVSQQRISINPRYLHLRSETYLLEILCFVVRNAGTDWWQLQHFGKNEFRYFFRDRLAEIIQNGLNTEPMVTAYINGMRNLQMRQSAERKTFRNLLFP